MISERGFERWMRTRQAGWRSRCAGNHSSSGRPITRACPRAWPTAARLGAPRGPRVETIQRGGDAEVLATGGEKGPVDSAWWAGAPLAPEAPELLGGGVALLG